MHRSAAPDKDHRRKVARKEGAKVVDQSFNSMSRHPEQQGTGHDERGSYGSAAGPNTPDSAPAKDS